MNVFTYHKIPGRQTLFVAVYRRDIVPHDFEYSTRVAVNEAFSDLVPFGLFHNATLGTKLQALPFHTISKHAGWLMREQPWLYLEEQSILVALKG